MDNRWHEVTNEDEVASPALLIHLERVEENLRRMIEIAGGVGVLFEATRRLAGIGLIGLCLAVLPANVQMLQDAQAAGASSAWQAVLWLRLPAQALLIAWIWQATLRRPPGWPALDQRRRPAVPPR